MQTKILCCYSFFVLCLRPVLGEQLRNINFSENLATFQEPNFNSQQTICSFLRKVMADVTALWQEKSNFNCVTGLEK